MDLPYAILEDERTDEPLSIYVTAIQTEYNGYDNGKVVVHNVIRLTS